MFSLVNWGCSATTLEHQYLNLVADDTRLVIRVLEEQQDVDENVFVNIEDDLYSTSTFMPASSHGMRDSTVYFRYGDKTLSLLYESVIDKNNDLEFDWRINEKIYCFKPRSDVTDSKFIGRSIAVNVVPFTHHYKRKPRAINKLFITAFPHLTGFIRIYPLQGYESLYTVPKLIKINSKDKFITNLSNLKYEYIHDHEHPLNNEFHAATTLKYKFEAPASIKSGDTTDVHVTVEFENGLPYPVNHTYLINPLSGYVPSKEVNFVDGRGSFRVTALGLFAGDIIKLEFYDGVYQRGYCEIPVV